VVVAEQTRLWETIEALLREQRVNQAHVVRHGGVSRNTLALIRHGTTNGPEPETLRKIARGIAADPDTGTVSRTDYVVVLQRLCRAAGLPDLAQDIPPCDLEAEIRAVVKDRSRARVLTAFIRKYPEMDVGARRLVDSLLDRVGDSE
jgi:transcriptional regulator with XRE-family HTH domain